MVITHEDLERRGEGRGGEGRGGGRLREDISAMVERMHILSHTVYLRLANLSFVGTDRNTPSFQEVFDLLGKVRLTRTHQEMVLLVELLHTHTQCTYANVYVHTVNTCNCTDIVQKC